MVDYYILKVHYEGTGYDRYISEIKYDYTLSSDTEYPKSKNAVVNDIENGSTVKTKYKSGYTWIEGETVRVYTDDSGYKYLRTDNNKISKDNLGNLPEY